MRVLTLNLWGMGGDWPARRDVLAAGLRELRPGLIAFQEAVRTDAVDTAGEIVGPEFELAHQTTGLLGDGNCAAIASRRPIRRVHEVDLPLTPRTADFPATTLIAEIDARDPLLFVNHLPSWKWEHEHERELQTVAAARRVEQLAGGGHVVLAGDLDAVPDAASIRFLRGLQSLEGTSVRYVDAWESVNAGDPGHTFTPANPLVMAETAMRIEPARRIDYVFVRCDDRGPTLRVAACALAFDAPVGGVWASDHVGVVADLEPA